ncbi:hypothetical protein CYMTET_39117, partial [Cymbomonas tetramitiformis]
MAKVESVTLHLTEKSVVFFDGRLVHGAVEYNGGRGAAVSETPKDVESSRGGKPGKGKSGGPMKRKASSVPAQASSPRSHIPKQRRSDLGAVRGGKETAADMDEESDEEMMDLDDLQAFSTTYWRSPSSDCSACSGNHRSICNSRGSNNKNSRHRKCSRRRSSSHSSRRSSSSSTTTTTKNNKAAEARRTSDKTKTGGTDHTGTSTSVPGFQGLQQQPPVHQDPQELRSAQPVQEASATNQEEARLSALQVQKQILKAELEVAKLSADLKACKEGGGGQGTNEEETVEGRKGRG